MKEVITKYNAAYSLAVMFITVNGIDEEITINHLIDAYLEMDCKALEKLLYNAYTVLENPNDNLN